MEIFGLVWVLSSIMASPVLEDNQKVGRLPQKPSAVAIEPIAPERMVSQLNTWLNLTEWAAGKASLNAGKASLNNEQAASALTPLINLVDQTMPTLTPFIQTRTLTTQGEPTEQILSWMPAIGTSLSHSLMPVAAPPLMPKSVDLTIAKPKEPAPTTAMPQWDEWAAVAAVRIEVDSAANFAPMGIEALEHPCMPISSPNTAGEKTVLKITPKAQIWVQDHFIGEVAGLVAAQRVATQLRTLLQSDTFDATAIKPVFSQTTVGIHHKNELLMVVNENLRSHPEVPTTEIAVQWVNNLRTALNAPPLDWGEVHLAATGLQPTSKTFSGTASWYGPGFHGRKTANGERYDQNSLTAAHKTLPFNTYLKVTNRLNGKSIVVRINDRGPYVGKRSLDLSKAAAHCLGSVQRGVIPYDAVILEPTPLPTLDTETTISFHPAPSATSQPSPATP